MLITKSKRVVRSMKLTNHATGMPQIKHVKRFLNVSNYQILWQLMLSVTLKDKRNNCNVQLKIMVDVWQFQIHVQFKQVNKDVLLIYLVVNVFGIQVLVKIKLVKMHQLQIIHRPYVKVLCPLVHWMKKVLDVWLVHQNVKIIQLKINV